MENKSNEVQSAGQLPVEIIFKAESKEDLNRGITLSDFAKIWIEELDLEMPKLKKPEITTFEGLLRRFEEDISDDQWNQQEYEPEQFEKINVLTEKLLEFADGNKFPVSFRIKDPSGKSHIENPYTPIKDKGWTEIYVPYEERYALKTKKEVKEFIKWEKEEEKEQEKRFKEEQEKRLKEEQEKQLKE